MPRFDEETVRLKILKAMVDLYKTADKPVYGIKFGKVELGPIENFDLRKRSAIGIVADSETKDYLNVVRENTMNVMVEFRILNQAEDNMAPGEMAERMLGVVQQVMNDNETLGGLIIKFDEIGNSVDMMTYADRTISGVVNYAILYRHAFWDNYDPNPTVS